MSPSRSRSGERGGFALELAMGLSIVLPIIAGFVALGFWLSKLGLPVLGRFVGMMPVLLPGTMNFWIAWRPGDRHEATPMGRVSSVVRGTAMVLPLVFFAVAPDALPLWILGAIFFGGMVLSFLVLGLERAQGGGDGAAGPTP